ncbi:uncharacterized protein M421DRAFT_138328 [Didymella exigua CBS 183.55]|uniref:Uncharacterized protein n=1 Tax=Didymella exigua CBS 183.55 TaxID=1150837 RepID=A0A6A5RLV5_9PLEO|nr:uncharacterized protein M421DRAFT_138328 [Didymella exigua CBS 183.55]KAF1929405.1 hypothetical protein M421DRAFT_138328 [Didymella exigua CBS 183.55]
MRMMVFWAVNERNVDGEVDASADAPGALYRRRRVCGNTGLRKPNKRTREKRGCNALPVFVLTAWAFSRPPVVSLTHALHRARRIPNRKALALLKSSLQIARQTLSPDLLVKHSPCRFHLCRTSECADTSSSDCAQGPSSPGLGRTRSNRF